MLFADHAQIAAMPTAYLQQYAATLALAKVGLCVSAPSATLRFDSLL